MMMRMIDVAATQQGIIASLRQEGFDEGRNKGLEEGVDNGKREIIANLLANHPLEEVAARLEMSEE